MTGENEKYLEMVKSSWAFLEDVPEEFQTDDIIDLAMRKNPWAVRFIKDEKKKTYERCLKAVRYDWWLIKYVPYDMQERVMKDIGNNL